MRRQPDLTFAEALRVLDRDQPGFVDKLDKALGGVILGAGLVAGVATLGTPLAPLVLFATVWGWVDQKNEAISLLRSLLKPARFRDKRGRERRELIEAAHSLLVASSFLDVLTETVGPKAMKKLAITDAERGYVATGAIAKQNQSALDALYLAAIPAPCPSRGFQETLPGIRSWIGIAAGRTDDFLKGLDAWSGHITLANPKFIGKVLARYESRYLALAADVPEFLFWSSLGEHAATRQAITGLSDEVRAVLDAQSAALQRLEGLLSLTPVGPDLGGDQEALHRANRGVLSQPVIAADAERYGVDVRFPTVGDGFVTPQYKITSTGGQIASEQWWAGLPAHDDLDLMLAAHFTSPNATRVPLLLLGHPGAGKSLLTKVIAARLPTSGYTVVRVPLRSVEASAPVKDQIRQALDQATNDRVSWPRLAAQTAQTVRVVLLDGLDELLQASQIDRSGYLREAMEFQAVEHDQELPVVVIVTSRTLVADRVHVPEGATIVKLVEFDDPRIEAWTDRWRAANHRAIDEGTIRDLRPADLAKHEDLARQPLLLLMLALYAADPTSPGLSEDMSTTALYERIFDSFARREAAKTTTSVNLDAAVAAQIERLSIAALGMFNRGAQYISEAELSADLTALLGHEPDGGKRLLAEFFFIHSPEALTLQKQRSYEFLHATFGEFLVARYITKELINMAHGAKFNRDGPNDAILFALLSHRALAEQYNILATIREILKTDDEDIVVAILLTAIGNYRSRTRSSQYDAYRPTPVDLVRQLAAYSANLITITYVIDTSKEEFKSLTKHHSWSSTIHLWQTLPKNGWIPAVALLYDSGQYSGIFPEGFVAQLAGDTLLARALAAISEMITISFRTRNMSTVDFEEIVTEYAKLHGDSTNGASVEEEE
ncbi:NACHT domain-containing protein [Actinokineospora diospyrosa]|uniref:ATPase family associated with various cellular activities (AAA) n=1 Tax=Actinokineospora diospyrosa TaxID=103728 RepID=A0ABT1IFF1_9PSEU|nr:AAA family ATPase [Actinokineospora diospyrosa]MCP2271372.1 ATPase family associated with various cellular activities (AAA) [Actinokineospora diospyrosa]